MGEKLGRRADANAKGAWTEMPVFGRIARGGGCQGAEVLVNHQGHQGKAKQVPREGSVHRNRGAESDCAAVSLQVEVGRGIPIDLVGGFAYLAGLGGVRICGGHPRE
jgi:hypothetical protein